MSLRKIGALVLVTVLSACGQKDQSSVVGSVTLESDKQKLSYALGQDLGNSLQNLKGEIDLAVLVKGIEDHLNEREPLLSPRECAEIKQVEMARIRKDYEKKQEELSQKSLEEGRLFLEENGKQAGVTTTSSGLQYLVLSEGQGTKPGPTDRVKVKYRGTLIDGKEFDSTEKHGGEPAVFGVGDVIRGWTEGLQLMSTGSKYRLFIPSDLAYGQRGSGGTIPPNSTLIFDVELLEIVGQ